jgi:hypothetical protein
MGMDVGSHISTPPLKVRRRAVAREARAAHVLTIGELAYTD